MTGTLLPLNSAISPSSGSVGKFDFDPPGADAERRDFRALARVLWRRKLMVLLVTAALCAVGLAVIWLIPPRYLADAVVIIGDRELNDASIDVKATPAPPNTPPDVVAIQTQADLIRSRAQVTKVVKKLQLTDDPEFNPDLARPGMAPDASTLDTIRSTIMNGIGQLIEATNRLLFAAGAAGPASGDALDRETARTVEAVLARLHVTPNPNSRVIAVEFESADSATAAVVANAVVDQYLAQQRANRAQRLAEIDKWLADKVAAFRDQVEKSDKAVEKFRAEHGLLSDGAGMSLLLKQMAETDAQLLQAQSQRASDDARVERFRALLNTPGGIAATSDALWSPALQGLEQQLIALQRNSAELLTKYLPNHPAMVSIRAEIDNVNDKIKKETDKVLRSLETEAKIAALKEAQLREREDHLKPLIGEANQADITLRALQREVQVNTTLLDAFMTRIKEGQDAKLPLGQQAQLVSYAEVPTRPAKPNKLLLAALALGGALIGAVSLAFTLERWDSTFRSGEEVEPELGVRVLGYVPTSRRLRQPGTLFADGPLSPATEALRSIHNNLRVLGFATRSPGSLLITSAQPGEGKTTLSLNFAALVASWQQRVIVVDADFRRRDASNVVGLAESRGLAELLTGNVDLERSIVKTDSGVDYIPAGRPSAAVGALAAIENLGNLIDLLKTRYDLVIVDSPPILAVSDALILSRYVDTTLFVLRWGMTPRKVAKFALRRLTAAGARIAGISLTMVDGRRHAQYGYSDSALYSRKIKKYQSPLKSGTRSQAMS